MGDKKNNNAKCRNVISNSSCNKILFVDHYDSFSFNLIAWLKMIGLSVEVVPHDEVDLLPSEYLSRFGAIALSPGPGNPDRYPHVLQFLQKTKNTHAILGICLGHQLIGAVLGFGVIRATQPVHGIAHQINLLERGVVNLRMPARFNMCAYNSLVVDVDTSHPAVMAVDAYGNCQILYSCLGRVRMLGVQFHPESEFSDRVEALNVFVRDFVIDKYQGLD